MKEAMLKMQWLLNVLPLFEQEAAHDLPTPLGRSPRQTTLQVRPMWRFYGYIQMKCKCNANSPFLWKQNPQPSKFVNDIYFRQKKMQIYENLTKEENVLAYKQFSIHSRANPKTKPQLNKHEIS